MHTNWTLWSRRFLTGLAMVGLVGFTFAEKEAVTWNVPTGWTTKDVPTQAEQVDANGSTVELEQNTACQQTLSERTANVAVVTNSSTAREVFGVNNGENSHGATGTTLARDVWLKVSGGSFTNVIGGSRNHWQNSHTTPLSGDIFLEVAGTTTTSVSGDVIGAIDKGGYGTGMTGNVLVVVSDGATVAGNVVGGVLSEHANTPTITGNTKVRILSVLTGGNRVLGGSGFRKNVASSAKHLGNTAVEVELTDGTSSTFAKEIVGGSYANTGSTKTNYSISGSTSVSITAPSTVTFSSPIYGASVAATTNTDASVGVNSSVTIEGGTYTSGIYAAGYGSAATVTSKATLTLKSGVFSGATLGVGNNSSTAKSSELILAGTSSGALDLSGATLKTDFKAVSLQGDVTLGTNRLTSLPALSIDTTSTRTITITLTDAEYALFSAELCTFSGTAVPANLAVEATYPGGTEAVTGWSLKVANGKLIYSRDSSERAWSTPQSGTDWSAGLSDFVEGDNVTFGTNDAQETVTLPTDGARVKDLTVSGNYLFGGTTGILSATTATIGEGGTLATGTGFSFTTNVTALRLTPSGASARDAQSALAELILTKDGTAVAWPTGTTIAQENPAGSPTWGSGGNEAINALIDGVYGSSSSGGTYTNPSDNTKGTYSGQTKNNKWWPQSTGARAVITLGSAVDFDGYVLYTADHTPRNPTAWTLEGSIDGGTTWVTLDTQSSVTSPGANSAYNGGTPYTVSCLLPCDTGTVLAVANALTVNGTLSSSYIITAGTATFGATGILAGSPTLTADTISFTEGSTIKVPASGVATLVGEVDGTAKINLDDYLGSNTPEEGVTFPVLQAPEGLTLTPPEGYMLGAHAGGYYTIYKSTPTWTAGSDNNTWSNLARWTGLADESTVPTSGTIFVNFGSGDATTLTIDTAVSNASLRVFGASGSAIELGTNGSLAVATLTAETDFTLPATATVTSASIATGKTLTLSGDGTLSTAFTSDGTLALADGTVTLADGVDLSTLTGITIGSGATLDFNGMSLQSNAFTLAGGTIKNSSSTTAVVGAVTLTADSSVDTTGGEVDFNSTTTPRKDLVLNNHTLTKTGSNLFKVCGVDVDAGTIYVKAGNLQLDNTGNSDSTLTDTTLKFASGAGYSAKGWLRPPSGTVTLEAEEGANVDFGDACIKGNVALTKNGLGTITLKLMSWDTGFWTGKTDVNAGTLVCNVAENITKGNTITIAEGATLKKTGSTTLTLSASPAGTGTIQIAGGTIKQGAAACGGFSGQYQIDLGATLDGTANGNYHSIMNTHIAKGIIVNGTLKVANGTMSTCPISGSGKMVVSGTMNLMCPITLTGSFELATGYTLNCADSTYLSLSGPDVLCDGTISNSGASITIAEGKTLSGTGSIAGAVTLSDGAVLDASTATTNTVLSLSTVKAGGNVSVVLPSTLSSGLKLLGWSAAPTGATYTAKDTTLSALASLRAKDTGLYYDVMSIDGGTAGSGTETGDTEAISELSDAVKRTLAEAAFDAGATSITSVTGTTQAGKTLTATAIDNALTCFALTPTVTLSDTGAATITVNYDFGISKFTLGKDGNDAPQVVVKAEVKSGENLAQLTSSATMVLQQKSISGSEEWTTLTDATFTKDDEGVYTATVKLDDISNVKFRVLAKTTTTD